MPERFERSGKLICIGGLPASGKTRTATLIADRLSPDAIIIDPDALWCGLLEPAGNRPLQSSDISSEMSIFVAEMARERCAMALGEGRTVIVPTAFMLDVQRTSFETLAREQNAEFHPFWLITEVETTMQRAAERRYKWDSGIREPNNMSVVDAYLGDPHFFQQEVPQHWMRVSSSQAPEIVADKICRTLSGQSALPVEPALYDIPRSVPMDMLIGPSS